MAHAMPPSFPTTHQLRLTTHCIPNRHKHGLEMPVTPFPATKVAVLIATDLGGACSLFISSGSSPDSNCGRAVLWSSARPRRAAGFVLANPARKMHRFAFSLFPPSPASPFSRKPEWAVFTSHESRLKRVAGHGPRVTSHGPRVTSSACVEHAGTKQKRMRRCIKAPGSNLLRKCLCDAFD
jgi:hypothetical protein